MVAVEVSQTLEYRGGQLNAAPVPEFENIISNSPFIPMAAGQRKPEGQRITDERKAANLDHLGNTNHVKDSELASLFDKLKYKENLIDNIYETEKSKSLVSATPMSTALLTTSIVQDFQDSPDDEQDTRSIHEYLNDLEEEYQARALLAKSKRFFKKGTQRFSSAKATDQTECHKCDKKGHFVRDCLITEMYDWDEEEVSSNDNEVTEVKALMALTDEERVSVSKESANNDTSSSRPKDPADNSEMSITGSNKPKLSGAEDFTLSNHDNGKVPSNESQRNTTNHLVVVSDSSVTDYDSADESSVYSIPLPPLEKLTGAEPVSGPKTIKSILKSKSTFKAETLKGIRINEPSSAPVRGNKSSSASKTNSAPAGKLRNVKIKDDPPLAIVMKELNELKLQLSKNKSSYFRNKNS
ncbi:retrovirus-related pol polyprotein from transposon TNT 1-94 [Tanacetum coccineum]